jgi:hypothetical protein
VSIIEHKNKRRHECIPCATEEMTSTQATGAQLPLLRLGEQWIHEEIRALSCWHEGETKKMSVNTLASGSLSREFLMGGDRTTK